MFEQLVKAPATVNTAAKKVAVKKVTRPANKVKAATVAVSPIKFAVRQGCRPTAGNLLKAQTAAFLSLSGMAAGDAFPKAQASKVIGDRAVQYHIGNGNFEQTDAGLVLTIAGAFLFNSFRTVDPELVKGYEQFFKDGQLNPAINVKNVEVVAKL